MPLLKDKERAFAKARKLGRKVIWSDAKGVWHCSTDRANTPNWATEAHDVPPSQPQQNTDEDSLKNG